MARTLVLLALVATLIAPTFQPGPALAAPDDDRACLSKAEQRAALSGGQTVTLAAAIGGVSGLLIGPITTVYYDSGFLIGLKGFVAAVFAGLSS